MSINQLPTLKPGDSHMESLIEAAIQGHADTRDAMRWLVRQLVPAIQQAESEPVAIGYINEMGELVKYPDPCIWMGSDCPRVKADRDTHECYQRIYTHPAPGVLEFSRIAKRKLDELQEQGFAITGYAIQRADVRGLIDGGGFVGWWQGETDPGVPDDVVRDAERWRVSELISEAALKHPDSRTEAENTAFNAYRAAFSSGNSYASCIDAAMLAASPAQKGAADATN